MTRATTDDALITAAQHWADNDPDPNTAAEVRGAIERHDLDALALLFDGRIAFGTAGLRAELGAGPRRMCRLVVRQTGAGLAAALRADGAGDGGVVVIGRDARHGSAQFAADIADVLAAQGLEPVVSDGPVPTPLIAFAVQRLGAVAGVVVTASHNPPKDNGVKVFWRDGAQITSPTDELIAVNINEAAAVGNPAGEPRNHRLLDPSVIDAYLDNISTIARTSAASAAGAEPGTDLRIVTTSLHGVGGDLLSRALADAGFGDTHAVASQRHPDPDFPTVAFPNPEEPGALDEALALAADVGADLVLANDPDADRVAAATPSADGGSLQPLRGDELGALLAHGLLDGIDDPSHALFATTVVSSQLMAKLAEDAGAHFFETLTGFKWLSRPGLAHPELHQALIYEEALGYAIGPTTRDKDGIAAAVVIATLATRWKAEGRSLRAVLDELYRQHGVHLQENFSIRFEGDGGMSAARECGAEVFRNPPRDIGGLPVVRTDRPAPDVLRCFLADGDRVVIRPSGTEPKLKCYCEVVEPPDADVDGARAHAAHRLRTIADDLRRGLSSSPSGGPQG